MARIEFTLDELLTNGDAIEECANRLGLEMDDPLMWTLNTLYIKLRRAAVREVDLDEQAVRQEYGTTREGQQ